MSVLDLKDALSPEELHLVRLSDRSIWSDEVELLTKILAQLKAMELKREVKWTNLLPARYLASANMSEIQSVSDFKSATNRVVNVFKGFMATVKDMKFHG
jgi:hypothetical protein